MGRFAELNKEQRLLKKRKGFLGVKKQIINNVNTGINLSTVNNESKKDNLNIMISVVVTTATATFVTSNETFSASETPSVPSSKVEDIEQESSKRKESISGNRIIDVNILSGIFGDMFIPHV